jgi:hypothetical protein
MNASKKYCLFFLSFYCILVVQGEYLNAPSHKNLPYSNKPIWTTSQGAAVIPGTLSHALVNIYDPSGQDSKLHCPPNF